MSALQPIEKPRSEALGALCEASVALKTWSIAASLLALTCISSVSYSAGCPLVATSPASLSGPLAGKQVLVSSSPPRVLFNSVLEQDDDGTPTAYHRGNADDSADPGLDHICNGASV